MYPHPYTALTNRSPHIAGWERFQFGSLLLMLVLLVVLVGVVDRTPVAGPEQDPAAAAEPTDPLARALDSLFADYDPEVLALLRPDTTGASRWVDSVMAALTLDEKIGQLFLVNLPPSNGRNDRALEAVEDFGVGSFLVSRAMDPRDLFEVTSRLQRASKVPLFFAADYERGVGQHNNNLTEWPSNMGLGATRDLLFAAAAGRLTAVESRAVGVNMILAPVVDVNNNPLNPIINIRSYGEDPALVGEMAASFVREAQAHGVLTTLKHFPGHGNTSVDTHTRMGTIPGDRNALDAVELYPYRYVLDNRVQPSAVMSAHLWIPALDDEPIPATFSRNALHHLLRDTMRFEGLVITDDVNMGALQNDYTLAQRITYPIRAGADMVLTPGSLRESVETVRQALRSGTITEAQVDGSVRRILMSKAKTGLHSRPVPNRALFEYILALPRGEPLAQQAADRAVTLLKNEGPLPMSGRQKRVLVQITNRENSQSIDAAMDLLRAQMGDEESVTEFRFGRSISNAATRRLDDALEEADALVIALYLRLTSGRGDAGLHPEQEELVDRLVDLPTPTVLVTLGNPYAVMPYTEAETLLIAYEQTLASVRSVSRVLMGDQRPNGRLPITVGDFPYGSGLDNPLMAPALAEIQQAGD